MEQETVFWDMEHHDCYILEIAGVWTHWQAEIRFHESIQGQPSHWTVYEKEQVISTYSI